MTPQAKTINEGVINIPVGMQMRMQRNDIEHDLKKPHMFVMSEQNPDVDTK